MNTDLVFSLFSFRIKVFIIIVKFFIRCSEKKFHFIKSSQFRSKLKYDLVLSPERMLRPELTNHRLGTNESEIC